VIPLARGLSFCFNCFDPVTTLAAFREGGFEVSLVVADPTANFGPIGGVVLSKAIAMLLMLGIRQRLWMAICSTSA
jgi:hypothetical protein